MKTHTIPTPDENDAVIFDMRRTEFSTYTRREKGWSSGGLRLLSGGG